MPQATPMFSATVTWAGVPVQRRTVHKERNLPAHAPRAPARGVQAPDQDPVRPAHSRDGGQVVLGLAGVPDS